MDVNEHLGVGLPDKGPVVVGFAPAGGAYVVPRAVRNLGPDGADLVADLQRTVRLVLDGQARIVDLVREGRAMGLSWATLGWCVGLTESGVRRMVERREAEEAAAAEFEESAAPQGIPRAKPSKARKPRT